MALDQFKNIDMQQKRLDAKKEIETFASGLTESDREAFDSVPPACKRTWMLVYQQKLPRGSAIVRAKCLDCCCWQREEVTKCNSKMCALWPYRPYQKDEAETNEDEDEKRE